MTAFELGVHVPLIIRAPGFPSSYGQHTRALAEAVDLYPTLASLAGLPDPRTAFAGSAGINGSDLAPVFVDPVANGGKSAAFSQFAKTAGYQVRKHQPIKGSDHNILYNKYIINYKISHKILISPSSSESSATSKLLGPTRNLPRGAGRRLARVEWSIWNLHQHVANTVPTQ
eukprot:COSAG01_NODE_397_length_17560_cov_111.258347_7_plen_172_part_00